MKVILPASEIPNGSTVTKRTGLKEYTLQRFIRVYVAPGESEEIRAKNGTVFLCDRRGQVYFDAYPGETELVWSLDEGRLHRYLHDKENEREDK